MGDFYHNKVVGKNRSARTVRTLIIATVAIFLLQLLVDRQTGGLFTALFGLNWDGVAGGQIWRFVTYPFLHGGVWHILVNMLMLYVFGRDIETVLGPRRFILLYVMAGVVAGLGWLGLSAREATQCIGASGAVFAIVALFATLYPQRRVTLLLYLIPITMSARSMALLLGGIAFVSLFLDDGNVAHAAHLAGGLVGYLYGRLLVRPRVGFKFVRWGWRFPRRRSQSPTPSSEEIDRLLEKISRYGLNSLSRAEKAMLERASRQGEER
ncbi:MAG: rhomboid family intramembrane serine protease [Kiritimatiellia bacterium]